jgi:hypothetical protein
MTTNNVTRFEVIDHTTDGEGRVLVRHGVAVELVLQDDGKTLKAFLRDASAPPRELPGRIF